MLRERAKFNLTGLGLWLGLSLLGCAGERASSVRPEPPQRSIAEETEKPKSAARPWVITETGVADVQLDAPLPTSVQQSQSLPSQYETSYYADAQPLEGFRLSEPPVQVMVSGGPFATFGMDHPGEPASAEVRGQAIEAAQRGKLTVSMIVITDPRVKTEQGIFVGNDDLAFARAYPNAPRKPMPALWEEPTCVAQEGKRWFFFDHCDEGKRAKIIRIVLRS